MKILLVFILFFTIPLLFFRGFAQDIHFSQFYEAPLLRNPALAGIFTGDLRLQTVYRTQWESVTVPYQTTSLNGEFKLPISKSQDFITVGAQILYDKAGTINLTSTHFLPAFNYHKSLSTEKNRYLSLGFMGGLVQRKFDMNKVTTNSQFDGTAYNGNLANGENLATPSYSYFDGSAGLSFNSQVGQDANNNFFVGIAFHHFNKNAKKTFYSNTGAETASKWVYSTGVKIVLTQNSTITAHADYTKQGSYTELITGALLTYQLDNTENPKYYLHWGIFMRWKDALIPVVKLDMKPLAISISYDANTSQLSAASHSRGGMEITLSYQNFSNRSNSSKDAVRCPRF